MLIRELQTPLCQQLKISQQLAFVKPLVERMVFQKKKLYNLKLYH